MVTFGELLICEREVRNIVDRCVVAMKNDITITVGHLPMKIS